MNKENMGEESFFDEVNGSGHIWLAMQDNNIYLNKDSAGTILLFVWSNKNKSQDFLDHLNSDHLKPIEWPNKNINYLFKQIDQIEAVAVNPTGQSNQISTYNIDEFTKYL